MSTAAKRQFTVAEYLAAEAVATQRHEFYRGEIFAMAGGSTAHNRISANIFGNLFEQLRGKQCLPNHSDVLVKANSLYAYPDVSVACPPIQRERGPIETLLNPRVLLEVLSPSTERYDRNVKFPNYQQVPSVQEIVLVQQEAAMVEHYARGDDGSWILTLTANMEAEVRLQSIGCKLPMMQIYANVEFPVAPFEVVVPPFPPG